MTRSQKENALQGIDLLLYLYQSLCFKKQYGIKEKNGEKKHEISQNRRCRGMYFMP